MEDHSNQLVRTFTGNLTKMLSQMPTSFKVAGFSEGGAAGSNGAAAATPLPAGGAGGAAARSPAAPGVQRSGGAGGSAGGGMGQPEWTALRLMQTFSGPVRRRLGTRSWGVATADTSNDGSDREASAIATAAAKAPSVAAPTAAAATPAAAAATVAASAAGVGAKRGKSAGRAAHGLNQRSVSRIDEGKAGEEQ